MVAAATRPRARLLLWLAVAFAVMAALVLGWLYLRGGGPMPAWTGIGRGESTALLARSGPDEQVLRALRLAGADLAVVGSEGGAAIVRLEVPAVDDAADVALAWQSAIGALREAYPSAQRYVVQVYGPGAQPLVELAWSGDEARASSDAGVLRERASVRYLSAELGGSK